MSHQLFPISLSTFVIYNLTTEQNVEREKLDSYLSNTWVVTQYLTFSEQIMKFKVEIQIVELSNINLNVNTLMLQTTCMDKTSKFSGLSTTSTDT